MASAILRVAAPLASGVALGATYWGLGGLPALAGIGAVGALAVARLIGASQKPGDGGASASPGGLSALAGRIHGATTRRGAAMEIAHAAAEIARSKVILRGASGWIDNRGEAVPSLPEGAELVLATGRSVWIEDGGASLEVAGWISERGANGAIPLIENQRPVGVILVTEADVVGGRRALLEDCARVAENSLRLRELQESADAGHAASAELDLAAELQQRLVPGQAELEIGGYELVAHYEPATHCAGDWWAIYELEDRLIVVVGDVTGHGLASAMVSAAAKGASDAYCAGAEQPDMTRLMELLDATVRRVGRGQFFMTCFATSLTTKGEIEFANAGHVAPYVVRADGRLEPLLARGNPLGAGPEPSVGQGTGAVSTDDKIIWYTDGLTERFDRKGDIYGDRRFQRLLRGAHTIPSARALEGTILESVEDFAAGAPSDDDITLVIARAL